MVHEAGHALWIRGGTADDDDFAAHPTVPGSVMNYDGRVDDVADKRFGLAVPGFSEEDCYPHPLDVMAIFALYQTGSTAGY